jgi:hypothetical protein
MPKSKLNARPRKRKVQRGERCSSDEEGFLEVIKKLSE